MKFTISTYHQGRPITIMAEEKQLQARDEFEGIWGWIERAGEAGPKGERNGRSLPRRSQPHRRRGKGEKKNKKQMAYAGAVYSIDRFVRSVEEVIDEVLRASHCADRPSPSPERVWAEMTGEREGEAISGKHSLPSTAGCYASSVSCASSYGR